jgi:hypothetical protein
LAGQRPSRLPGDPRDLPSPGLRLDVAFEILEFIEREAPKMTAVFFQTIVSAMRLQPDAERLSSFLEDKLGDDGELLAATILHGGGSQTRVHRRRSGDPR